jgi:rhomboid protease GluP
MPDSLAIQPIDRLLSRSVELMSRYPTDPRTSEIRALFLLKTNQTAEAETLLRRLMTAKWPARPFAEPQVRTHAQALLAAVLAYERRRPEALALANPICGDPSDVQSRQILIKAKLCADSAATPP